MIQNRFARPSLFRGLGRDPELSLDLGNGARNRGWIEAMLVRGAGKASVPRNVDHQSY